MPFPYTFPIDWSALGAPFVPIVELATLTGQFPATWTDITAYVRAISYRLGQDDWLQGVQPSTGSLLLDNSDYRFMPERASSPLYPHVDAMRAVQIRARLDSYLPYDSEVRADSPVAYWRLSETTGTTARDWTASAENGTYTGGYTLGQTGALAGEADAAVLLNGTSGYVALPTDADLNITGNLTLEAWLKTTSTAAHTNIFAGYDAITPFAGYGVRLNNGKLGFYSSGLGSWVEHTTPLVNDGAWHHVAVTLTGTAVAFYVDGAPAGTATSAAPGSYAGVRAIGARAGGGAEWFAGTLDEVVLYTTALSAARIAAHYQGGAGTTYPLYYGYIDTITPHPRSDVQDCTITLADARQWYLTSGVTPTLSNTTAGVNLAAILSQHNWPVYAQSLAAGSITFNPSYGAVPLMSQLTDVGVTHDGGIVYWRGDGYVVFEDRSYRTTTPRCTTPQAAFTASMVDLQVERPLRDVINDVIITYTGGGTSARSYSTSWTAYGQQRHTRSCPFFSSAQADALGDYLLSRFQVAHPRPVMSLLGSTEALQLHILARRISDRITVTETARTGINGDFHINSMTVSLQPGAPAQATWQLAPV